jgi:pimeloyl-ACP methyl ester carboxylesterase
MTGILTADKPRAPKWVDWLAYLPHSWVFRGKGVGSACPPERQAEYREVLRGDKASRAGLVQQQRALRAYATSVEAVRGITVPTLVLHGTEDAIVPIAWGRELAMTIRGARFISYTGVGHNYLVAVGDQSNQDVLEFVASVDASQAVSS